MLEQSDEGHELKRFILTGAPGAGKTAILRQLEVDGFSVAEEAATDVIALWQARGIAEPWRQSTFIDAVADLQRRRALRAARDADGLQFHDRSVICTAAVARYLGYSVSQAFSRELKRIEPGDAFQKEVFFVRNRGSVEPTAARRISFEDSLRFEQLHEESYRGYGFTLIYIEPGSLADRVSAIHEALREILARMR